MTDKTDETTKDKKPNLANLRPIRGSRSARKADGETLDRLAYDDKELDLAEILSGRVPPRIGREAPKFPHKLIVVAPDYATAPIILKLSDNNTCERINPSFVAGLLRGWNEGCVGRLKPYRIAYSKCEKVVRYWTQNTRDLSTMPKSVGFKSDPELCFKRLPFDYIEGVDAEVLAKEAPVFCEMLSRIETNAEAFCTRIGSIYDLSASRKQAVWMYGETNGGKSLYATLIEKLTGESFTVLDRDILNTEYWKADLPGKRVAFVHEAIPSFIRSGKFKNATGDANHHINQKYAPTFSARLDVLMFFISNDPPEIPHDDALLTRIIDCRIGVIPEAKRLGEVEVLAKLDRELPWIASYCMGLYAELPRGAAIPSDQSELREHADDFEGDYLDFLENRFDIDPDPSKSVKRMRRDEFKAIMTEHGIKHGPDQQKVIKIMMRRFKILKKRERVNSEQPRTYAGISPKPIRFVHPK